MASTRICMLTRNIGLITVKSKLANIQSIRAFSIFDFWPKNPTKINRGTTPLTASILNIRQSRSFFTEEVLKLEPFTKRRETTMKEYSQSADQFFSRLEDIIQKDTDEKAIYSNDLTTAIYLCDGSDRHVSILLDIVKHLLLKTKEETPYPHYSVIRNANSLMQLFHHINRPDLVVELFVNQERFPNLLDIVPTLGLEVAMDLLERNSNYQEIIDIYRAILGRSEAERGPFEGAPSRLKDILISVINSIYKLGTLEAYQTGLALIIYPGRKFRLRTHSPIALLALKHGDTSRALDLLLPTFTSSTENYVTVYNMRIKALQDQGRVEEALVILKNLAEKSALSGDRKYTLASDVMEALKATVEEQNNPDNVAKLTDLTEQLKKRGCLSQDTLDEIMLGWINKPFDKTRSFSWQKDNPERRGRFDYNQRKANFARGPGYRQSGFSRRADEY